MKANLKYDNFPVVSKEYSKLRKEAQHKRKHENHPPAKPDSDNSQQLLQYVIAVSHLNDKKTQKSTPYYFSTTVPTTTEEQTTRQTVGTTRHLPFPYNIFNPDINKYSKISFTTTKINNNYEQANPHRPIFDPSKLELELTTQKKEEEKITRPVYIPSLLEDVKEQNYRFNRPVYNPNRLTTTPTPRKVVKIKNNVPIFQPMRQNTKIRRPIYKPREELTTQRPRVIKIKNNRPIYEGTLEARSEEGPDSDAEILHLNQPTFDPSFVEMRIPYDKYQNERISRPVFDPSTLELATHSRNKFQSSRIQRPVYDPVLLNMNLEDHRNFRNQKTSFRPSLEPTTEKSKLQKLKIHLPNLDPNRLTTPTTLRERRPIFERIKLILPPNSQFPPVQSTIYPDSEETTTFDDKKQNYGHLESKFAEFLSPLTTTDDGLTHPNQISRRKYETTPNPFNNIVEIEINELIPEGRNNRRFDEQVTELTQKENAPTTEISTVESSTEVISSTTLEETTTDVPITEETTLEITTNIPTTTKLSKMNVTTEIIANTIECIDSLPASSSSNDSLEERMDDTTETETESTTTEFTTTEMETTSMFPTTLEDVAPKISQNQSATVSPLKKIDELEAILNISAINKKEEDYEYDYNEPTLPPSLPNLRIIPFVAADAVEKDTTYPSLVQERINHVTDAPVFTFFSPPTETEGISLLFILFIYFSNVKYLFCLFFFIVYINHISLKYKETDFFLSF